jgi:hypothetical protein
MSDRDFWLLIRRALMMIVSAIDKKFTIAKEKPTPNPSSGD